MYTANINASSKDQENIMRKIKLVYDESEDDSLSIIKAKYSHNYVIDLEFSDGLKKQIDFRKYLFEIAKNPMTTDYQDLIKFQGFKLIDGNVDWDDYTMIFHVEDLHAGTIFT